MIKPNLFPYGSLIAALGATALFVAFTFMTPQGQFSNELVFSLSWFLCAVVLTDHFREALELHRSRPFEFFISLDEGELKARGWLMVKVEPFTRWQSRAYE